MIESLVIKATSAAECAPPEWIKKFIQCVREKQFGFIVFGDDLGGDKQEGNQTDENTLIQPEVTHSASNKVWRNICSLINRGSILIAAIFYILMSFTLMPFQTDNIDYQNIFKL